MTRALMLVAAFISLSLCCRSRSGCSDDIKRAVFGPSGQDVAAVIVGDCGATVGPYTFVVIESAKDKIIVDRDQSALVVHGVHSIDIEWMDATTIRIGPAPADEVLDRKTIVNGVKVVFR